MTIQPENTENTEITDITEKTDVTENTENTEQVWSEGHLVLAKLRGHPVWPARIVLENSLPPSILVHKVTNSVPVYFFGSHNFGWIAPDMLKDYHLQKAAAALKGSAAFKKACLELEDPQSWLEIEFSPVDYVYCSPSPQKPKKRKLSDDDVKPKPKPKEKKEKDVKVAEKIVSPTERLLRLRQRLQKFLQQTDEQTEEDFLRANERLVEVEGWPMDIEMFKETKIGKVVKHLAKKGVDTYQISDRCERLVEKWKLELIERANEDLSGGVNSQLPNVSKLVNLIP